MDDDIASLKLAVEDLQRDAERNRSDTTNELDALLRKIREQGRSISELRGEVEELKRKERLR